MAVAHEDNLKRVSHTVYEDLLKALESARTRLAVAIAAETKATPVSRWNAYLQTAEEMRRCLKRLRALPHSGSRKPEDWTRALDILRQIPRRSDPGSRSEAHLLCQHLQAVLTQLRHFGEQ
jgi:hypothetical protein